MDKRRFNLGFLVLALTSILLIQEAWARS